MSGVKLEDFRIPLDEIKLGTDNFSAENYIGGGGFGKVYKGKLQESSGHIEMAVKRLDAKSLQGKHEFLNEISLLFSYRHENIITFIGYCDEANEMIVVYEYATNHSLDKYLYDTNKMSTMSWEQRLKICIGAAKGLSYLHWGLGEHHRVIHRDIKSANILLDENWVAKISDFGLSKIGPKDLPYTHLHTKVAGTLGYCDPNYYGTDVLRKESDVYSFGVVLFEMLSGRLVYRKRCNEDDEPESLVEWVRCCFKDGLEKIIDPHTRDQIKSKSLNTFKEVAYRCLKIKVNKRPTMDIVIQKLEEALEFQVSSFSSAPEPTRSGSRSKDGNSGGDSEWTEKFKPGVYVTLTSLPGGVKDIKRVRFSRRHFSKAQAEQWWAENRAQVYEQYNIRMVDKINNYQPDSASASADVLVEHEEKGKEKENNLVDDHGNQEKESLGSAFITRRKKNWFFWKKKEKDYNVVDHHAKQEKGGIIGYS